MKVATMRRVDAWLGTPMCALFTLLSKLAAFFRRAPFGPIERVLFVKLAIRPRAGRRDGGDVYPVFRARGFACARGLGRGRPALIVGADAPKGLRRSSR